MKIIILQVDWKVCVVSVFLGVGFGNFDLGVFIWEGKGFWVWDEDGIEFIDYLIGFGLMIFGYGYLEVLEVVEEQFGKGMMFFINNVVGIELVEVLVEVVFCVEQVWYVLIGGEVDMYVMCLVCVFIGCDKIFKFEGGYYGMFGEVLMSFVLKNLVNFLFVVLDFVGILESVCDNMLIVLFNDVDFVVFLIEEYVDEIVCVIVELL